MKYAFKTGALLALTIAVLATQSFAANLNFNVPDGSWFTGTNWTPAGPPTVGDNARIGTAATLSTALARINTGGTANANNVVLGLDGGTNGTLRINNGSTLAIANDFVVGAAGTGTFDSIDGSTTNVANNMAIGNLAGSIGTVTVHDNSTVNITGNLAVGNAGDGTLRILNTSSTPLVQANDIVVGNQAGSTGLIEVNIPTTPGVLSPATLVSHNDTIVGNFGDGTMRIINGAFAVTFGDAVVGRGTGSTGLVVVNGSNVFPSEWDIAGNLSVGNSGSGELDILNGGLVGSAPFTPVNVAIGRFAGSSGLVKVDGAGSTLNVTTGIFVGGGGAGPGGEGELRITNGGTVNTTNLTVWGPGSGDRGTLSVDSTYTLNDTGTLAFVGGRLNFVGDGVNFTNDANLTNAPGPDQNGMFANVSAGNTATISGFLTGSGDLTKTGAGTLILTNTANNYRDTNINNGALEPGVAGDPFGARDVNVNTGGTLRTAEGMPLSYTINRDLNVNGGTFYAQVGGTNSGVDSDLATAIRDVNLDPVNSHLFVHRINGYNPNNGDVVTIISSFVGTLNGQFSDAPQAFAAPAPNDFLGLIQPFADYGNIDPGSVDLVFGFAASFASVAKTPNQIATAEALDAAVAANCIPVATNFLGNQPINTLRHAYDLIAPEELASMYEASFAQGMVTSLNLQHRMDDIRWGSTGFCADGFVIQDNHGYTKNDGKSVADKNPAVEETAPPSTRWGAFITGSGELTKVGEESENDPGAHGYQLNQAGFTMGVDYRVTDHWAIGLSGGYTHTHGDLVDDGRLNTDGGRMGLYTTWYTGGFYVDASASGGWNQYDTRRTALLGQENGSTDGAEFNGMVAAGYDWKKGCWTFGPTASFEYDYVEFNSFTEGDTSLIPLHFPDQNQSAYRSNLGFRVAHEQVMKPGEGLTVVPELRASWRHDFGSEAYAIDSNFVGCDDTFTVHGPWIGRDSAVVDLGLTAYCTPGLSAYIFYDGQFGRDNYNNNGISGGFRVAF